MPMKLLALALVCIPVAGWAECTPLGGSSVACTAPLIIPDTPHPTGYVPCWKDNMVSWCAAKSDPPKHHWTAQPDGNTLKLDGTEITIGRLGGRQFTVSCAGTNQRYVSLRSAKEVGETCADEDAAFKPTP